jgi:hypothetical protein
VVRATPNRSDQFLLGRHRLAFGQLSRFDARKQPRRYLTVRWQLSAVIDLWHVHAMKVYHLRRAS